MDYKDKDENKNKIKYFRENKNYDMNNPERVAKFNNMKL